MNCNVGTRNPGSTLSYPFVARVRSEVPNGTVLGPVVAGVTSDDVTTPVETNPVEATVSARPQFDISKNAVAQVENRGYLGGGNLMSCPSDPAKRCFRYLASVLISTPNGGKGSTPLASPIVVTDDLSPAAIYGQPNGFPVTNDPDWIAAGANALQKYGAELVSCPFTSVFTAPGIGVNGTNLNTTNAVRDSGTFTCTQPGGPGTPVTISIANADTTAYTVPTTSYYPNGAALPADIGYVVAGRIDFAIPYDAVIDLGVATAAGADLTWDNKYTSFEGTGIDGTPNDPTADAAFNNHRTVTTPIRARGSWSKVYVGEPNNVGNTPPTQFAAGFAVWEGPTNVTNRRSGDGVLLPGQVVMSGINLYNQSTSDSDVSFLVCDNWDNTKLRLAPGNYPGSTSARLQQIPSNGEAVWFSGYRDNVSYRSLPANVPVTLNVEYGTGGFGTGEDCEDSASPTGWQSDPNLVPGGIPAINKVRIHAIIPPNLVTVGTYTTVSIALEALPNPVGTLLPNFAAGKTLFGTHDQAAILASPTNWARSSYNPADNTGNRGDRIYIGAAISKLLKEVKDQAGNWVTTVPSYTTGATVDYRLRPSLTSGHPTDVELEVSVEDCLPASQTYTIGSASIPPTVIQLGAPAGAELACPAGQTYVRWDLGPLTVGAVIPPITYSAQVSGSAPSGVHTNNAVVIAEGDPSTTEARSALAQIQIVAPVGVAIDKRALTPQSDINIAGEANLDELLWLVSFRNLEFPGALADVDAIDVLPANGLNGTSFNGTLEFSSATVVAGTGVTVLYTNAAPTSISQDGGDPTNLAAGTTIWCDQPAGGAVVSGAGTAADCPANAADVTGLRFLRPGPFEPTDLFDVEIAMVPEGNLEGDIYVNQVSGRADGLLQPVGPVSAPEVVVAAELGDIVWDDLNGDGIQDLGEPGIDGITVSLYGVDDDGNPVGSAGAPLTTVTAGGGLYLFDQLPAGTYTVVFDDSTLTGGAIWTLDNQGGDDSLDSDGDPATGTATGVVLNINQNRLDVDQGVVRPALTLLKTVNGVDANAAPGPTIQVGDPAVFEYVVTNTGNLRLVDIDLVDDVLGAITCPATALDAGEDMTCTVSDVAVLGAYTNTADVTAQPVYPDGSDAGGLLEDSDPANYFGGEPGLSVVKSVNGDDANTAPGPLVAAGSTVTFDYIVTNTGNLDLDSISLDDDVLGPVTCPATTLAVGASMACSVTDEAVADAYTNVATVTGQPLGRDGAPFGEPLTDDDPANYFGGEPSIGVTKLVNGFDANNPTGPLVDDGDPVTFTYVVENTGNLDLDSVALVDDVIGAIACPATTLAVGEQMTCTITDVAVAGPYTNTATVTAQPLGLDGSPFGAPLTDDDPANYFGLAPDLTLVKSVNGDDANTAPGPEVRVGAPVVFDYVVTNTGNVELVDVALVDDILGPISCPANSLAVGAEMTCTVTDVAAVGTNTNVGTVTGQPNGPDNTPVGEPIDVSDPANYTGVGPAIEVVKSVNGDDANAASGPQVRVGESVLFTYVVTNTGDTTINGIALDDDVLGAILCPQTILAPGESMICEATDEAVAGSQTNVATVTGQPIDRDGNPAGDPVSDDDPATYFGADPAMTVVKALNGATDTEAAPPVVTVGDELVFTYVVTNTGNVAIDDITVVDDVLGPITCPAPSLEVGQSMTCDITTLATSGTVTNVATVTGAVRNIRCVATDQDGGEGDSEECEVITLTGSDNATYVSQPARLAFTGSESNRLTQLALTLLAAGALTTTASRRLRREEH